MTLVDGVNARWVASVLTRNDRRARIGSRALGIFLSTVSFVVAALGAVRYFIPFVDAMAGTYETVIGLLLIFVVAVSITVIRHAARGTSIGQTRPAITPPSTS